MRKFYIPFGENEKHKEKLELGLSKMVPEFSAHLCGMCNGLGEYRQTYTVGCGGGYFKSMGTCEYCDGIGLAQGMGYKNPAPMSVLNQVLVAAESVQVASE